MTPEQVVDAARRWDGAPGWGAVRAAAAERFARSGLPGNRDEAWKYTRAAALLARSGGGAEPAPAPSAGAVAFSGGRRVAADTGGAASVCDHPDRVGRVLVEPTGFVAMNLALATDGVFVRHEGGEHALALDHRDGGAVRHVIELGAYTKLFVVERHHGSGLGTAGLEATLGEHAELVHVRIVDGDGAHHGAIGVELAAGASYRLVSVVLGGGATRIEPTVRLAGRGATAELYGLLALRGAEHADHHVTVDHAAPHCTSRQVFRSLLDGKARGVFTGKVVVRPGAAGTDSSQVHRALLLSDDAVANARPQLEIDADDVKCAHGAAVGSLDPESLFYLQQRGLDAAAARGLLTAAFAAEVIDAAPSGSVHDELRERVASWLAP